VKEERKKYFGSAIVLFDYFRTTFYDENCHLY